MRIPMMSWKKSDVVSHYIHHAFEHRIDSLLGSYITKSITPSLLCYLTRSYSAQRGRLICVKVSATNSLWLWTRLVDSVFDDVTLLCYLRIQFTFRLHVIVLKWLLKTFRLVIILSKSKWKSLKVSISWMHYKNMRP